MLLESMKAVFLGIVEGVTEWLPISSTGHMILVEEFMHFSLSDAFMEMFNVVIQLGAILAVVLLFWNKLWPFRMHKKGEGIKGLFKADTFSLWVKVLVASLPALVVGLPFEDTFDAWFFNPQTVALMLIVYGVAFIWMERLRKPRPPKFERIEDMPYRTALFIGLFQVLALIPGTSRSGATILGAVLLGVARPLAAEFSFFLAIPAMAGASLLKIVKFMMQGMGISGMEIAVLLAGTVTAFLVSLVVIRYFLNYIKKHDFAAFGVYRIVLGVLVGAYFLFIK